MDLAKVSTARRVVLGAGVVLLIWSFFPWNGFGGGKACGTVNGIKICGGVSASWSVNAWHGMGIVMGLFLIALLVWEAILLVQVVSPGKITLPELPVKPILISLAIGALTVLFGVIRVFEYGAREWEIWIALLLMAALAGGLFLRMQDEGGAAAVK